MATVDKATVGMDVDFGDRNRPFPMVKVQEACTEAAGRWWCITHKKGFDNQLQKDGHISTGKHVLTWVCYTHGPEVP